jgi:uncharacterized SAM-binding protein YcdF (DUF218 family)
MFVFLSKFLPLFVYPVGLAFFGLLFYLWLTRKSGPKGLPRMILWLVVIVLFVGGNRWVEAALVRSLEWQYLPPETLPLNAVVVVLGGGTESNQPPRQMAELNGAGDRVMYAARLYHDGVAEKLLLSGGNITMLGSRTTTPAEDMLEIITLMGVPTEACWLQNRSQNTYEDALYSAEMLNENGITEIVLVTSAMHMPRSVPLFEHQGLTVISAPADYSVTTDGWASLWSPTAGDVLTGLIPQAGYLSGTSAALKEYIGMLVYSLRGWV